MNDFKFTKLSELVSRVKVGFVGSINEFYCEKENGIPLIRTTDISELGIDYSNLKYVTKEFHLKNKKSQIKKGDLIIARHGENGKANVFNEDFDAQVLNAVIIETNQNKLESNLLKYFFDSPFIKKQILGVVKGSVQGVINTAHIADVLIPINNKIKYKDIAKILNNLDSKIELNNRINAELESMAKTLYDYWFVQFDFPDKNGKPYKTSGGKMVWNEELKREVPEGWEVANIEKSCSIIDCLHSKKSDLVFEEEQYYLLQLENIKDDGLIDLTNKYFVTKDEYKKWTTRIEVVDGDIVITNAGRVAATAQIPNGMKAGIGRNITAIRPVSINPTYLFLSFGGADIQRQIKLNTDSGAFFTSFNVKGIKKLQILRPKSEIEKRFEEQALPLRRKRELNIKENQKLTELRDWLLPMLMNGQVKVN